MRKLYIGAGLLIGGLAFVAVATPVFAQGQGSQGQQNIPVNQEEIRAQAQERRQTAQQQAEERVDRLRTEADERRAQIQQEVCERQAENFSQLIPRLATQPTALLTSIDTVYDRVQGFYADGQLTVDNYDELKGNVDTAQVDATAAAEAVEAYQFELDCDNPNVGEQLDGFRASTAEARESLNAYRSELIALISTLRAEAASNAEDTEEE